MSYNTKGNQILTLTGLRFDANLGILEHEDQPQPIQVDAELNLGTQPCCPPTTTSTMCSTTARCARSSSTSARPST
jgi:hypothetical protein